jgi:alanyl-tRNA synthetase
MNEAFQNLVDHQKYVSEVIRSEEENFNKTLDRGIELFDELVVRLNKENRNAIPGEEAFRLYDTYGFPLDLTRIMAEEKNMTIDEWGFKQEMELQRNRARNAGKFKHQIDHKINWKILKKCPTNSRFVGYDKLDVKTEICKYSIDREYLQIVLSETPFYAESGGQVADKGILLVGNNELQVIDVKKHAEEIVHICEGPSNITIVPSDIIARVNPQHRLPIMYNHTATHLLHASLRKVLGNHVQQAGSLVAPERLRFDFTHFKKISQEELSRIEQIVNEHIRQNIQLEISYSDLEEAQKRGAMALFGEKYEDEVRIVTIKGFSMELCGGTHVQRTGEIGSFFITQESSIASGIRRIEAITGPEFIKYSQNNRQILNQLSQQLNLPIPEIPQRINYLNNQIKELEKELQKLQTNTITERIDDIIEHAEKIGSIKLAIQSFKDWDMNLLKNVADLFREKAKCGIILLINQSADKLNFVCAVTDDLIKTHNIKAGELVGEVSKITGGGGGGRAHLATAGGKNHSKLPEAIDKLKNIIKTAE